MENNEQPTTAVEVLEAAMKQADASEIPLVDASVPAEPDQVETEKKPEAEIVPKQDEAFAKKFAALSRKEKEVRKREQQVVSQMKQVEERMKQLEARLAADGNIDEQLKSDPLTYLEKKGLSYKDLTEKYLLKPEVTPEQKQNSTIEELRAEIQSMRSERDQEKKAAKDEADKKAEQAQKQQVESAKQDYLNKLTEHVNGAGEKYELIVKNDAVQLVYEVMEEAYSARVQEAGEQIQLTEDEITALRDEAADAVESHLLTEAKKLIESNKLKGLLGTVQPKSEPSKKTSPTLSNNLSQQSPTKAAENMSDDESKRYMASLLKYVD